VVVYYEHYLTPDPQALQELTVVALVPEVVVTDPEYHP
jgi:hypothetical protein